MANKNKCTAIKSSTGLGKSTVMRKRVGNIISDLKAKDNTGSVVVFVPTIKLAQEQMMKFRKESLIEVSFERPHVLPRSN